MKRARDGWWALGIPLVLAALVFVRSLGFPFVNWDDPSHFASNPLAEHPLARGLRGLFLTEEIGYPAPVLLLSFALDRALFGMHAAFYHAENVALHLGNVWMLFRIARRMRLSSREACAVATIFAIHPLVVEPVCWVTGRKDLLATAMVLGASLLVAGPVARRRAASAWRWLTADGLAALSVLVLPRMVIGPFVILLLTRAMRPRWSVRWLVLRLAPALPFGLAVTLIGARQIKTLGAVPPRTFADAVLDIGGAWALQLGHVVMPVDLATYYFRVPGDPPVWAMIVALAAALALVAYVATRVPPGSPARTGVLLTIVAYAPASSVLRIVRWTADSYMYLPILGLSLTVVPLVARAWPPRLGRVGVGLGLAGAVIVASLSLMRTETWSSSTNVWAGSVARNPDEPLAYEHEALGLLADGHVAAANVLFRRMAERFPSWEDTLDDEVRAYEEVGDHARANEVLARGVRLGSPACTKMYWLRLLASPTPPGPEQRDLVATAFQNAFASMKEGVRDPAFFRRVAAVLQAEGLVEQAREAAAAADALERHPAPP
jgi:hypothetical protein